MAPSLVASPRPGLGVPGTSYPRVTLRFTRGYIPGCPGQATSNRSEHGAATQTILMSIYRTLPMGGRDPTKTMATALKTCLQTGRLPPLPDPITANG